MFDVFEFCFNTSSFTFFDFIVRKRVHFILYLNSKLYEYKLSVSVFNV